ncbi:hypothetical protein [Nocardia sp. IFM 10818]
MIVQLAARVHELRHQLHGAVAEWVSLQIDYQQLRFGEPRAGREELHARAMRYVTTELGLSVSDR